MTRPNRAAPPSLEHQIEDDSYASDAFDVLIEAGAEAGQLWQYLASLQSCGLLTFHRWRDKSSLDRRQARTLVSDLREIAGRLDYFLTPDFRWYAMIQSRKLLWWDIVPKFICFAARAIELLLEHTDERGLNSTDIARRALTEYVRQATGTSHDREVADLLRVVLGLDALTAEEQRKYRTRDRKTGRN